ncbi:MAG TPA: sugar-binding protein [Terriglobia bacterium]|jgi:ribose transport system substrate-binding protein
MKKALIILIPAILLAAGCGSKSQAGGDGKAGKQLKLAFVTNNSADFWTMARRGVEKADAELSDVSAEFRITSDGTAADQKRIIDDLMTKGVDGIAISLVDPQNQTALLNDVAKHALVFTQDSDAPNSERTCYVGTDNIAAGRQAGQLIKEALPDGGKIMLFVGKLDARNAQDRIQGIKDVLQDSRIKIIDTRTDDVDSVRAKSNAADTLVKYPDIKALVGLWSYNGPAILNAVKDARKTGQVKIVAFDEADETIAGIQDGSIYGTIVQQPFEFGYQAITLMTRALKGDKSFIPDNKQIIIPTMVITRSNVDGFAKRLHDLLGK